MKPIPAFGKSLKVRARGIMKSTTIIFMVLAFAAKEAAALDLKGVHIGDTYEPKAIEKLMRTGETPIYKVFSCDKIMCSGLVDLGGRRFAEAMLSQDGHGKVRDVFLKFPHEWFPETTQSLVQKLGKPDVDEAHTLQNS